PLVEPPPGGTVVYDPAATVLEPVEVAALVFRGRRPELEGARVMLGRSKDADIQVPDPNVSRRHAEVRLEGSTYTLVDLDSTNGVEYGGRPGEQPQAQESPTP